MATRQTSVTGIEHEGARRFTRHSEFLTVMDGIVECDEWVNHIRPNYHSEDGRGRPAHDLKVILRMYLMQVWFSLSDVDCEETCMDIWSMRSFLGKLG
jgi:IS5 family transposase